MNAYRLGQIPVDLVEASMVRHSSFKYEFNFLYITDIYHRIDALGESHKVVQSLDLATDQHEKYVSPRGHGHGLKITENGVVFGSFSAKFLIEHY
jgi:hypothetical protein